MVLIHFMLVVLDVNHLLILKKIRWKIMNKRLIGILLLLGSLFNWYYLFLLINHIRLSDIATPLETIIFFILLIGGIFINVFGVILIIDKDD